MSYKARKNIEAYKYIVVGGVNTLFGYGAYSLFIFSGFHYGLAVFFATIIGIFFNFKTYGRFVFSAYDSRGIANFIVVYVFVYLSNVALVSLLSLVMRNLYINGLLAIMIAAFLGYTLNKRFVWRKN